MENEIETYEKQKDNRGYFVECDLSNHFYNIHDISGDSLFLKKLQILNLKNFLVRNYTMKLYILMIVLWIKI